MSLIDKTILEYVDDVDSLLPAPGGGSVASLVGALGVCLAKMLGHFTFDKKKYKEASAKQKEKFVISFEKMDYYKDILIKGIDDDAIAYDSIASALKSKDEERISKALLVGCLVAYEIQDAAFNALKHCKNLIALGNKYLYSDLISSAILLDSCVEMSSLNVLANAKMLKDEVVKNNYIDQSIAMVNKAKSLKRQIINLIGKIS